MSSLLGSVPRQAGVTTNPTPSLGLNEDGNASFASILISWRGYFEKKKKSSLEGIFPCMYVSFGVRGNEWVSYYVEIQGGG